MKTFLIMKIYTYHCLVFVSLKQLENVRNSSEVKHCVNFCVEQKATHNSSTSEIVMKQNGTVLPTVLIELRSYPSFSVEV